MLLHAGHGSSAVATEPYIGLLVLAGSAVISAWSLWRWFDA